MQKILTDRDGQGIRPTTNLGKSRGRVGIVAFPEQPMSFGAKGEERKLGFHPQSLTFEPKYCLPASVTDSPPLNACKRRFYQKVSYLSWHSCLGGLKRKSVLAIYCANLRAGLAALWK